MSRSVRSLFPAGAAALVVILAGCSSAGTGAGAYGGGGAYGGAKATVASGPSGTSAAASSPATGSSTPGSATSSGAAGKSDYGSTGRYGAGGYGASPGASGSSTGTASGSSPSAPAISPAGAQMVSVASGSVGSYLTGEGGKTLYVLRKDPPGHSTCTGGCASVWPPFALRTGGTVVAGAGVTGALATIQRADGSTQVTYRAAPLYYFSGDASAGDTNGQGINGVWFVAQP